MTRAIDQQISELSREPSQEPARVVIDGQQMRQLLSSALKDQQGRRKHQGLTNQKYKVTPGECGTV